ncbi:FAD-dependent thymidylate synthase [Candidatus Nephthysia bennettiae]
MQAALPRGQSEFDAGEIAVLERYFTNMDGRVFALKNLPEVVKGALFSRYSRTEKSLRRVLLEEFLDEPATGLGGRESKAADALVAADRAEEFYHRVLVGYGDDSVAELAGAHLAMEGVSTLAAKALEDSRIGISPLEKSTRYVRFDRPGPDGRFLYYRGPELGHRIYALAMEELFRTYSELVEPLTERIRRRYPIEPGESERAWKSTTRAKALDLLRGLLPAAALTNLGLYGNGRAFEYLITKTWASDLPECRQLAIEMHGELGKVIPAFIKRALDERHGSPAAARLALTRRRVGALAPPRRNQASPVEVRLVDSEPDAERKVLAAALFPHSDLPLEDLKASGVPVEAALRALMGHRGNRRHRAPRALEHASYTFEITANFGAYRDLQRHRMLTQDRQLLGTSLGYDVAPELEQFGVVEPFVRSMELAAHAHHLLESAVGPVLSQYAVPLAFRLRWYFRTNLREVYHLCELRTTPQGHPDYRHVAQEMFRRVREVHPRLAEYARFVDLGPGDELERRASERRIDDRLSELKGQNGSAPNGS